jgi:hypothetical protein
MPCLKGANPAGCGGLELGCSKPASWTFRRDGLALLEMEDCAGLANRGTRHTIGGRPAAAQAPGACDVEPH